MKDLLSQAEGNIELIIGDDGSSLEYYELNRSVKNEMVQHIRVEKNSGRSFIRNLLASKAKYDHLLFLDSDVEITNTNYLENYFNIISKGYEVVCGGTTYPTQKPDAKKILHWKYSRSKEKEFAKRDKHSYRSFMTNNFMIEKRVFGDVKFDETITGYGHEDTLFGYELSKRKIKLEHVNNAVLHTQLDDAEVFLEKTRQSVKNLIPILSKYGNEKELIESITLLRTFFKLSSRGLKRPLEIASGPILNYLKGSLKSATPSLKQLDLYKLALFTRYYRESGLKNKD